VFRRRNLSKKKKGGGVGEEGEGGEVENSCSCFIGHVVGGVGDLAIRDRGGGGRGWNDS